MDDASDLIEAVWNPEVDEVIVTAEVDNGDAEIASIAVQVKDAASKNCAWVSRDPEVRCGLASGAGDLARGDCPAACASQIEGTQHYSMRYDSLPPVS